MIEIVAIVLGTLRDLVTEWVSSSEEARAALEKRVSDAISVMKGERTAVHDEIAARDAETRRIIEEARTKP